MLCCHCQNDSCIQMGSDESHFNLSLIVRVKVKSQESPRTPTFKEEGNQTSVVHLPAFRFTAGPDLLTGCWIMRFYELYFLFWRAEWPKFLALTGH